VFHNVISTQQISDGLDSLGGPALEDAIERWASAVAGAFDSSQGSQYPAVLVDNSLQSHIALLGIARRKLTCAVIDAHLPGRVLAELLQYLDASEVFVLEGQDVKSTLSEAGITWVEINQDSVGSIKKTPSQHDGTIVTLTSGSTGQPKGVVISFSTLERWVGWRALARESFGEPAVVVGLAPLNFAAGILNCLEIFSGASVVSIDPSRYSPRDLIEEIAKASPTVLHIPAQLLRVMSAAAKAYVGPKIDSLRLMVAGSGAVETRWAVDVSEIVPVSCLLSHHLSASESARFFAFTSPITDLPDSQMVPIGLPRSLDDVRLEPVIGNPDTFEAFVSGPIAERYVDEEHTSQRWLTDESGRDWWKTGDLVRWDENLSQYFHAGRIDDLVKIGGYLVSTGDVHRAILEDDRIRHATVFAFTSDSRTELVAYVEVHEEASLDVVSIRGMLREKLPRWAIPKVIREIPEIPLTSRGKVDVKSLREIEKTRRARSKTRHSLRGTHA
jgi:acyl-CoA synthetase (AMP-forming)/AMP-acid ligase II